MKVQELRVGNYVYYVDEDANEIPLCVDLNDICNIECDLSDSYKPIPLTEEWLVNLGFNKFPNQKIYDRDDFWYCRLRNGNEWHFEDLECIVKYVNQLQNLYFALTGKELEIKQ